MVLEVPAGESGKLFGSINNATVAEELEKRGVNVERKRISIPNNTIKNVGEYTIQVRLYDNDTAEMKVSVQRSEG
jgi:large subunit ribosomal protein L9